MNQLPKIEYKNQTVNGTTAIGSDTITGITDTSLIEVDMVIDNSDFIAGTKVVSKTATTITLDSNSIGATTTDRNFYFEIVFNYPPTVDDEERLVPKARTRISEGGVKQVLISYIEFKLVLTFSFLTLSELEEIKTFYKTHASLGNEFKYFPNSDEVDFVEYEADNLRLTPKKVTPILYEVRLVFRRAE